MTPRVIGLDLSLTATGVSDGQTTWVVRSTGHKGDTLLQRRRRLLLSATETWSQAGWPALVAVEGPSYGSNGGSQHDRSGLWWFVVSDLIAAGIPVVEIPPTTLKKYATGKGTASKAAMVDAAARRLPHVDTGADPDRIDALWLAAMALDHLGAPLVALPQAQRDVLAKVAWPVAS